MTWWTESTGVELQLLLLALVCSLVVGVERQYQHKSAGMRTHVLVALGAAGFTLVSAYGFRGNVVSDSIITLDPSRIAAQIVSGIGFLGAGVIFVRRDTVRGLTTAAGIWMSAAIGMACGAGMPTLAIALTTAHVVVLTSLARLGSILPARDRGRMVEVTYVTGQGVLRRLLQELGEMDATFLIDHTSSSRSADPPTATVTLRLSGGPSMSDLVVAMADTDGILKVRVPQPTEPS